MLSEHDEWLLKTYTDVYETIDQTDNQTDE